MKEFEKKPDNLTNKPPKTYSEYGGKTMPENVDGQQPPEQNGNKGPTVSPEQIANAKRDWTTYRGPLEKLTYEERQSVSEAVKFGRGPLSQEEIKEINDKFSSGPIRDMWNQGFDEDIRKATMDDVISRRSAKKSSEETPKTEVGGGRGGTKPSGEDSTNAGDFYESEKDGDSKSPVPLRAINPENANQIPFEKLSDEIVKKVESDQLKTVLGNIKDKLEMGFDEGYVAEQMAKIDQLMNESKLSQEEIDRILKLMKEGNPSNEDMNKAMGLIREKKLSDTDMRTASELKSRFSQWKGANAGSLDGVIEGSRDPELAEMAKKIIKVFSEDVVREELKKNNPNLDSLLSLKHLIDNEIDPTRQDILLLANTITSEKGISIKGKETLKMTETSKKLIYEWLVEKIISIPDSTPDAHYNIGSFYITSNLDSLIDIARRKLDGSVEGKSRAGSEEEKPSAYLSELKHYRQAMHELNLALRVGEQYKEFVLKELSSNGFDFVNNRLVGVGGIIRLYEKAYSNKVRETRKWLSGQDVDNIDKEIQGIVNAQAKNGEIVVRTKGEGGKEVSRRVLTRWEMERALRLGRILFSGSQRKAIYTGFGDIPAANASRIGSMPDEYVVRSIFNWKIFAPRFYGSNAASRSFIKHIFDHARSIGVGSKGGYDNGVFGVKSDTLIENSFGAYDMQSHGWRSELLFLGNQLFEMNDGKKVTLEQLLNSKIDLYAKINTDDQLWGVSLTDTEKTLFVGDVRKMVLGQDVYLSSLVRYSNFDNSLKADLWRKRASMMPSTAITLLPKEMLQNDVERKMWDEEIRDKDGSTVRLSLRHRLYRAEERRIQDVNLSDRTQKEVEESADNFEKGKNAKVGEDNRQLRYRFIEEYCKNDEFTDAEREFLKKTIDRVYGGAGIENGAEVKLPDLAGRLAQTNMSFTLTIDDTPEIAWKKKGKEYGNAGFETADFIRLLSSDQEHFTKGWQPMVSLTESPQSYSVKAFEEAVENIGNVIGRGDAQKKIEPFIAAEIKMLSMDHSAEFVPGLMGIKRLFDKPTSEIERFFKKTYHSLNAPARKELLISLMQARALGAEGFDTLRKKTRTNQAWVLLTMFYFWAEIIGLEGAQQMFKSILPDDMGKSL